MVRRIVRVWMAAALLLLTLPAWSTAAQEQELRIALEPESGPPGTRVTMMGSGAPAGAQVSILASPFSAEESRFFPETGHTVSGRFLEYWNENGGLMVFGYPLTQDRFEINSSGDYVLTQYFERQRFERHPENNPPYDVLLGRMGVEVLNLQGSNWQEIPRAEPATGCMYFVETGHNVCNQAPGQGFLSYWQSHGLDFGDPGVSFRESLALFGYPITEPFIATNSSGDTVLTQWFERARFEWHPNNPDQFKVLLGRLGAELLAMRGNPPVFENVTVYLIAEGQGNLGCGDAVVPVERQVEPTVAPLTAAFRELLSLGGPEVGPSGLYNALYRSDLHVESVEIVNGTATIRLAGNFQLGGVCDSPRVEAQLTQTALQFDTVDAVEIYINGVPLDEALSLR
ncbi:MAG: hypothetical protein KatS3mg057_1013 [Herpetosiphonaceae bacterium]|nr:MAG: hypothetical protein KatS3mg057_1013 [Herpetosiphonaceae bacterium]